MMVWLFRGCLCFALSVSVLCAEVPKPIEMAERIDALVEKKLASLNLKPNSMESDEVFLRRASLNIIGRAPTIEEAQAYLNNNFETDKSLRLVDQLLDHSGYALHQTNWLSDIFRAKSKGQNNVGYFGQVFIDWIKKSMAENMPFDKFVYIMLSNSGDIWDDHQGPLGYYMRDYRMPQDNLANTMQIFLGTRMVCAQCHDHPFDKWTQMDFFKLSAFMNGMEYVNSDKKKIVGQALKLTGLDDKSRENKEVRKALDYSLTPAIMGLGNGHARLPYDYQYDDAAPGDVVKAAVPFGPQVELNYTETKKGKRPIDEEKLLEDLKKRKGNFAPVYEDNGSRAAFAAWLTSQENPRFAKVLANRLWKRVMGMGLIEPVDDIKDGTVASDPALLDLLQAMVIDYNFDLKEIYRTLYYTKTFARLAQAEDRIYKHEMGFAGPMMKRLTAEQMWDSLLSLRSDHLDQLIATAPMDRHNLYEKLAPLNAKELAEELEQAKKSGQSGKAIARALYVDSAQSSAMMDHPKDKSSALALLGPKPKNKAELKAWLEKRSELRLSMEKNKKGMGKNNDRDYSRAANMELPARAGSFLYQLGHSTKDEIEGANDEANIPQVLTFMNGMDDLIYSDPSKGIWKALQKETSSEKNIETLFLGTLTRRPNAEEMSTMLALVKAAPKTAYQDILWILANTHEFKFSR